MNTSTNEQFTALLTREITAVEDRLARLRVMQAAVQELFGAATVIPTITQRISTSESFVRSQPQRRVPPNKGIVMANTSTALVMSVLNRTPELVPVIASTLNLSKTKVSNVLGTLEKRGYAVRSSRGWTRSDRSRERPDGSYELPPAK